MTDNLFSYRLDYEEDGTLFDGNIRKQYWKSNIDGKERSYEFSYDGASRLKSGSYGSNVAGENYSLNNVNYDFNGNITALSRNGWKSNNTYGLIDNLNYTYNSNSNKLLKVDDNSSETASFKDVVGNDYEYWLDGSLKKDNNKEITQIDYNYLKLPEKITLTGGRWIEYEYDAGGTKLKKTLSTGKYTDYEEDEIYEDGILYQTLHDEGRIVDGEYEYNITDHLGNLRVAFKDSLGIAKITQYENHGSWGESLEGINYSRPTKNNFNFSTYEKENDFGINVFDAHARMYDPLTPRFWQIDPKSELSRRWSVYCYTYDNPIRFIDPDGMFGGDPVKNPRIRSTSGSLNKSRFMKQDRINNDGSVRHHYGVDILLKKGDPVGSMVEGKVTSVVSSFSPGEYKENSFGNTVTVQTTKSDGSSVFIMEGHLDKVTVKKGDPVKVGQQVGEGGNTGNAANMSENEIHTHIEASTTSTFKPSGGGVGTRIDPEQFMETKFDSKGNPIPATPKPSILINNVAEVDATQVNRVFIPLIPLKK